jgi:predicted O-methyltransferase YrrM
MSPKKKTAAVDHQDRIAKLQSEMKKYEGSDRFYRTYSSELLSCSRDARVRAWYDDNGRFSMLKREDLCGVTALASMSTGPILEIGTYVGGVTVALGRGSSAQGSRIVCIDKGGSHLSHPRLPSEDILADWRANVEEAGFGDRTVMIDGNYGTSKVQAAAVEAAGEAIGLVFMDADGRVDAAFNGFARYLSPDALVMIDDYASPDYQDKAPLTRAVVDKLCDEGILVRWGLLSGQTWLGQLGPRFLKFVDEDMLITRLRPMHEAPADSPFCAYVVDLPEEYAAVADEGDQKNSPLILLEDGEYSGLGHFSFEDIGKYPGSFTHYRGQLAFSTRDGSDPLTNGRRYEIVVGDQRRQMILT